MKGPILECLAPGVFSEKKSKKNWMEQLFISSVWQIHSNAALSFLQLELKVEWWSWGKVLTYFLFELKKEGRL